MWNEAKVGGTCDQTSKRTSFPSCIRAGKGFSVYLPRCCRISEVVEVCGEETGKGELKTQSGGVRRSLAAAVNERKNKNECQTANY